MMKRRSFLALLGLAPLAPISAAAIMPAAVNDTMREVMGARTYHYEGKTYVVRDYWSDGSHVDKPGLRLVTCEYATIKDGAVKWTPTYEGVLFDDIEPFA